MAVERLNQKIFVTTIYCSRGKVGFFAKLEKQFAKLAFQRVTPDALITYLNIIFSLDNFMIQLKMKHNLHMREKH